MFDVRIKTVDAWMSLNSHGHPTLACRVVLDTGHTGLSQVPSGTSCGRHEAAELRDKDESPFGGHGVEQAITAVSGPLRRAVVGMDARNQSAVDGALISLDETGDKSVIGANSMLAISIATACAAARALGVPLWRHLASLSEDASQINHVPRPMVSLLSGGLHSLGAHPIQDFLVIPLRDETLRDGLATTAAVRASLEIVLRERSGVEPALAQSGALVNSCTTARTALELLNEAIERAGFAPGREVGIAVDLAASNLLGENGYVIDPGTNAISATEVSNLIATWCADYGVVLVEDPLDEDDWTAWASATRQLKDRCTILGDDLFATSLDRLTTGIRSGASNAILLKPTQRGTLSEVIQVSDAARRAGFGTVVSQRSVETEDSSSADLAVACNANLSKFGPLMHSERLAKYNRLLEVEAIESCRTAPWQPNF